MLSAAYAAPKGVKENSPPGYSITAPTALLAVDIMVMMENVDLPFINLSAEDMAGVEITQEYASHITDVDINPLYRWHGISVTDKTFYYLQNGNRTEGYIKNYDKPDPVPNK